MSMIDFDDMADSLIIKTDVEDYLTDEGIDISKTMASSRKIGFV